MDVKTAFLNGVTEEELYIEQPPSFETHVCQLKKELYGLKQSHRAWYERIDDFLMSLSFTKSKEDSNLYYKVENHRIMILLLYVDVLFLTGKEKLISECKKNLVKKSK